MLRHIDEELAACRAELRAVLGKRFASSPAANAIVNKLKSEHSREYIRSADGPYIQVHE